MPDGDDPWQPIQVGVALIIAIASLSGVAATSAWPWLVTFGLGAGFACVIGGVTKIVTPEVSTNRAVLFGAVAATALATPAWSFVLAHDGPTRFSPLDHWYAYLPLIAAASTAALLWRSERRADARTVTPAEQPPDRSPVDVDRFNELRRTSRLARDQTKDG